MSLPAHPAPSADHDDDQKRRTDHAADHVGDDDDQKRRKGHAADHVEDDDQKRRRKGHAGDEGPGGRWSDPWAAAVMTAGGDSPTGPD